MTVFYSQMMYSMLVTHVFTSPDHFLEPKTAILTLNYLELVRIGNNVLPMIVKDWVEVCMSFASLCDVMQVYIT